MTEHAGYNQPPSPNLFLEAEDQGFQDGAPIRRQRVSDPSTQAKLDQLHTDLSALESAIGQTVDASSASTLVGLLKNVKASLATLAGTVTNGIVAVENTTAVQTNFTYATYAGIRLTTGWQEGGYTYTVQRDTDGAILNITRV